jgi:hypothetical protein
VALYAFHQGVENAVSGDFHKDCERQFMEQLKRAEAAEAEVERLTAEARERANAYSVKVNDPSLKGGASTERRKAHVDQG